MVGNETIGLVS